MLVLALAAHVSGCSYIEMVRRHQRLREAFEKQPRLAVRDLFNHLITPAAPPRGILDDPIGTVKRVFSQPARGS